MASAGRLGTTGDHWGPLGTMGDHGGRSGTIGDRGDHGWGTKAQASKGDRGDHRGPPGTTEDGDGIRPMCMCVYTRARCCRVRLYMLASEMWVMINVRGVGETVFKTSRNRHRGLPCWGPWGTMGDRGDHWGPLGTTVPSRPQRPQPSATYLTGWVVRRSP